MWVASDVLAGFYRSWGLHNRNETPIAMTVRLSNRRDRRLAVEQTMTILQ